MHRAFALLLCVAPLSAQQDRPNFVWLISEDNSKHYLRMYDADGAPTPRIEALAEQGIQFLHAFSNAPVCSVARTTLMTSCYAPRIGTFHHRRSVLAPMPKGLRMFPAYLRDAGYFTTNRQKKDYNAKEGVGVWDQSSRRASWRNRRKGQPFFHMQSFTASHEGRLHFKRSDLTNAKTTTNPQDIVLPPYHPDTPTFRYTHARYHDCIRRVDAEIGGVVDQLAADGLLEDTFVFYFGDHGGVLPRSKGYAYESGLHVPLVVRIPAKWEDLVPHKRGSKAAEFVSFVDFGPTLLHLAGLGVPDGVDGAAFLGAGITKAKLEHRIETFGYADRFDEKYDHVRTLRRGRFKYIRSYQPFNFDGLQNNYRYRMLAYEEWRSLFHAGKLNATQRQFFTARAPEALYDLAQDPHETVNLAGSKDHAKILTDLRHRLRHYVTSLPDLGFYPESVLVDQAMTNPTAFGQARREEIRRLVSIADLTLGSFPDARERLGQALASDNAMDRYHALIACSTFGKPAQGLADRIRGLAKSDADRLVRVRAAEFLGLQRLQDPRPVITECLKSAGSKVEAALILNSVVLLRDGPSRWDFQLDESLFPHAKNRRSNVFRRLQYLRR